MTRRSRTLGLAAACAIGLSATACTGGSATPPASSPTPTAATTPTSVNAAEQAASAAADFLKDNSYTITGINGSTISYGDAGQKFTSKVSCEGGPTHTIGWNGVCTAPAKEAISVVVVVSLTTGPKVTTYALDEDAAAYCGDDTTPAWVKASLKKAAGEYCFLRAEDG